jgi:hypothetical protein
MTKHQFLQVIKKIREQSEKTDSLYTLGIDIINITESYNETINILLESVFGNLGASSPKVITCNGKKIKVDTAEKLYNYLEKEGYLKK